MLLKNLAAKSDLSDFYTIEQLELEDARWTLGECHTFMESRYQSAISLDILFCSFFTHPYPLIMVHQFTPGDLRFGLLPQTRPCLA